MQHSTRILDIIDNQVRDLRKRQVVGSYVSKARKGAYWGIRTDIQEYAHHKPGLRLPLGAPHEETMQLADIATRLAALDAPTQERLINWATPSATRPSAPSRPPPRRTPRDSPTPVRASEPAEDAVPP